MNVARLLAPALLLLALPMAGSSVPNSPSDAFAANRMLGRGINFGNALEAPKEGDWGLTLKPEYFEAVQKAGFQSVRVPIKWSAHAKAEPPYTIDPEFFKRIDWVIDQALAHKLAVLINVHHYDEVYKEPDRHAERLNGLWKQIAERYRARPPEVMFELLNEPNGPLSDERWNAMIPGLIETIRRTNPQRAIVVGPSQWNAADHLARMRLPEADRMLIGTFHYYLPFKFTHQGAEWAKGSAAWLGTTWTATPEQTAALSKDFQRAADWSKQEKRPLLLGEFGAYSKADMESRARWTNAVTREAEKHGFSWSYWEFGAGFGAYDRDRSQWREPLLRALLPPK